jgi:hypothetical protein
LALPELTSTCEVNYYAVKSKDCTIKMVWNTDVTLTNIFKDFALCLLPVTETQLNVGS